jgi:hypothetical protein
MPKSDDIKVTSISKAHTLEAIGGFWDTHSLDDYWDQTREVEFELRAKRGRRVTLGPVSDCKVIVSILQSIIL